MNIDIRWDNQKRDALVCEFKGDWTWHECREAMQVMMYMQEGSGLEVDHIYDLSKSTLAPRACLNRLQKLLQLEVSPAPRQVVIVDKDYRANMLNEMLSSIAAPLGLQFVSSVDAARLALSEPELF
jgi:hypothetical protein